MTTENEQITQDASQTAEQQVESSTTQTESAETDANRETVPKKDFNKVYWKAKQAEREIEELKSKISQQQQTVETHVYNQQVSTSNEPTLEEFDYDQEAYTAALVDHRVNQNIARAFEQREQQNQQQKQQSEHEKITRAFQDRYARYASENPEYQEISTGAQIFAPHVNQAILHAENGPQVDHYLLTNPDIAERVSNLNPVMAAIEIGKISANLGANKTTTISKAPDPIETVGGGNINTSDVRYDDNSSMEAYYAAAMAKKRGG